VKKLIITLISLGLLCAPLVLAAKPFGKTGTAALQFLKLGVDARAIGMGEAYTAVSDDISSVYWNPAGLAPAYQNQAFFSTPTGLPVSCRSMRPLPLPTECPP